MNQPEHDNASVDHQLMARLASGDASALEQLVRRHGRAVAGVVYRYLGRADEVEDLVQEVFLRVFRSASRYRPEAKFTTWLFRIATNLCLNHRSRWRPRIVSPEDVPLEEIAEPSDDGEGAARIDRLREAIEALPPRQRMALSLQLEQGTSYAQIAETMQVSVSSVEAMLFRARQALKDRLDE